MTRRGWALGALVLVALVLVGLPRGGAASTASSASDGSFEVLLAKRSIDFSGGVVVHRTEYSVQRKSAGRYFTLLVPAPQGAHLSFVSAESSRSKLRVQRVAEKEFHEYQVTLREQEDSFSLSVTMKFLGLLEAYPVSIKQVRLASGRRAQGEDQLMLLRDSATIPMAYPCQKQTTVINVDVSSVERFTEFSPSSFASRKVMYGPYESVDKETLHPIEIHFERNGAILTAHRVMRELEVSLWGNLAVEELYELENTGAALSGGFSRIDYEKSRSRDSNSPRELLALLPGNASAAYYRDIIGNISTSHFTSRSASSSLQLLTRYPLFGGWKTEFYIGYNAPLGQFVQHEGSKHVLKFKFAPSIRDLSVETFVWKVILPEGAADVSWKYPYAVEGPQNTTRFTYLDSPYAGRPVLTFSRSNVLDDMDEFFEISYTLTLPIYREPLMVIGAYFFFFSLYIGYRWVASSSGSKTKTE